MVETEPLAGPTRSVEPPAPTDPALFGEVAIVHDYLNQRGGAERVVLELARIWPQATIYTSLYRPDSTFPEFRDHEIRTSPLDHVPVDSGFRALFPLYPAAFRSLGRIDADVVISSSSGWAHMVRTSRRALHVVYCHTPARWLYRNDYLVAEGPSPWRERLATSLAPAIRSLDRRAARRAHLYVANSHEVQRRIADVYGIHAEVVYPPVDLGHFTPQPRGERLLVVARLLPYKRVDLAMRAADRLGLGLDIVGQGPMLGELRRVASRNVNLHGAVPETRLVELLESCRAVCITAEEDFGIVAVEAQAAGKPVVAYAAGGALETVAPGVTGVLFDEQTEDCLVAAIAACDALTTTPGAIAAHAGRFSRAAFARNLLAVIAERREH